MFCGRLLAELLLKASVSFFLRIPPSSLMSLEKKPKRKEQKQKPLKPKFMRTLFLASSGSRSPFRPTLLIYFLIMNFMWAGLIRTQGYGSFSASDVSVLGDVWSILREQRKLNTKKLRERDPRKALPFDAPSSRFIPFGTSSCWLPFDSTVPGWAGWSLLVSPCASFLYGFMFRNTRIVAFLATKAAREVMVGTHLQNGKHWERKESFPNILRVFYGFLGMF